MDELFLTRMNRFTTSSGVKIKDQSALIMNKTFTRDTNYKEGNLYGRDDEYLDHLGYKYQKVYSYSLNKDKVEFVIQFRPYYHPEKVYGCPDGIDRLGFIIDVPNDLEQPEKWLILGRDDTVSFTRYNILKINWTFHWVVDGKIYSNIGVLRNRNNYNSGIWSDGFTTTVQNEAQFIVPSNDKTKTIDYGMRFMLSDNEVHPKVYTVAKVEDTFPLGAIRITLTQGHFDAIKDDIALKVCDYHNNAITPTPSDAEDNPRITLSFSGKDPFLYRDGSARQVKAVYKTSTDEVRAEETQWTFYLNGTPKNEEDLIDFAVTHMDDSQIIKVKALKTAKVGDIITVRAMSQRTGIYETMELEVKP